MISRPAVASASSAPAEAPRKRASRIGPLDTFRCLTVTLALLSHGLLEFHVDQVTNSSVWLTLRVITRSATPGLLLLFGVMAEVVYFRRYLEVGSAIRGRLVRRAAQCYITFVALAGLVALCQSKPTGYFLQSLGFLTLEGYNVIFALYAFLLFALMILLPVRQRWGFPGLAALLGVVWIIDGVVLSSLPAASPTFKVLADITIGTGGTWGPSAFHSISLVIAGMIFGHVLYRPERAPASRVVALGVLLLACSVITWQVLRLGGVGVVRAIVDLAQYRAQNHPAYYAYGVLGAAALLPVAYLLDAVAPDWLRTRLHQLGGLTFSYFVIGNAILIMIPDYAVRSPAHAIGVIAGYLGLTILATLLWAAYGPRTPTRSRSATPSS